ncbi:hypothetical protein ACKKBF_B05410 [Auxenochlorella protothecoides x Auxenochlorella symbiontica]|uniref:rRNA-processing protein FYV7 n=1 Tax=Auxenochlorella protothecoides TaxID=3075 RepID=A0A1D1ZUV0_AUXPR
MPLPGRGGVHAARGRGRGRGSKLDGFARGKQSTYDPVARREKERALNAKTVNKYRKLQKRLAAAGEHEAGHRHEGVDGSAGTLSGAPSAGALFPPATDALGSHGHGRPRVSDDGKEEGEDVNSAARFPAEGRKSHGSQLLRLAEKVGATKEAAHQEAETRRAEAVERKRKLAQDKKRRAAKHQTLMKRTGRGQPVMKHRIEMLLDKLQS